MLKPAWLSKKLVHNHGRFSILHENPSSCEIPSPSVRRSHYTSMTHRRIRLLLALLHLIFEMDSVITAGLNWPTCDACCDRLQLVQFIPVVGLRGTERLREALDVGVWSINAVTVDLRS